MQTGKILAARRRGAEAVDGIRLIIGLKPPRDGNRAGSADRRLERLLIDVEAPKCVDLILRTDPVRGRAIDAPIAEHRGVGRFPSG